MWSNDTTDSETRQTYQYVFELRNHIEDTCRLAREQLASSQLRYKRNFDKKARVRTLEVGNQVLVLLPSDHRKLVMHWKGPYEVTKKVGVRDYQIRVGINLRLFHVNMLKRYLVRTEEIVATATILDPEDNPSLEVGSVPV